MLKFHGAWILLKTYSNLMCDKRRYIHKEEYNRSGLRVSSTILTGTLTLQLAEQRQHLEKISYIVEMQTSCPLLQLPNQQTSANMLNSDPLET
jgi:hypothetical protein